MLINIYPNTVETFPTDVIEFSSEISKRINYNTLYTQHGLNTFSADKSGEYFFTIN